MHQVAEFPTAEPIVAEILDDRASVRVGISLPDLVFRQSGISLEQERLDLIGPPQVYDFLVRQNGVRGRAVAAHEHNEKDGHYTDRRQAPTFGHGAWRCCRVGHGSNATENQNNGNHEKDQPHREA
jgi:hypothetical protein